MSTEYRFTENKTKDQVIDLLPKLGLEISKTENDDKFCITNGDSYVWCYILGDNSVDFTRYGQNYNVREDILLPLAKELKTGLLDEEDEGFIEEED